MFVWDGHLLDLGHDFVGVPRGGRLHAPGEPQRARLDLSALVHRITAKREKLEM